MRRPLFQQSLAESDFKLATAAAANTRGAALPDVPERSHAPTRGAVTYNDTSMSVGPLTPRQQVEKFFADIGLGGLNVEHVIEAVIFDARPLPKGRENDAARMAEIILGGSHSLGGPPIYAEHLTEDQVAERKRLQPILSRMMGDAEQRTLAHGTAYTQEAVRRREWVQRGRVHLVHQGRARRPACNERTRGSQRGASTRSSSRSGDSGDDDPPGVSHPPARRETAGRRS